jgi:hypothetical protein
MSLFRHRHQDHVHGPLSGAPDWARYIADQNAVIIAQDEIILAKLEDRPCKLSPEDQATVNEMFDKATATAAKADAALAGP